MFVFLANMFKLFDLKPLSKVGSSESILKKQQDDYETTDSQPQFR